MNKIRFPRLGKEALMILHCGFPMVLAALIGCCFYITSLTEYDAARLLPTISDMLRQVMLSLLLTVGRALLLEASPRERRGRGN